jgi:hypothetical protein
MVRISAVEFIVSKFVVVVVCMFFAMTSLGQTEAVGLWHFDDGSGTTVIDSSSSSNDGTLNYMDTQNCWINGRFANGLEFDGTNDYVSLTSAIDLGTAHTVCAWVCANDLSYYEAILGYTGDSYMSPLMLMNNSGNTRIYYHDGTAYEFLDLGEDITGEWHHIAVVRNETAADFFLDGVKKGSVTLSNNTAMYADVIGARQGNSSLSFFYSGGLDDVWVYDKALNAEEINLIYNGCIGIWKMNEGEGTIACDCSTYGNDASLIGAYWDVGHINDDGYFKNALNLDGTNDYVSLTSTIDLGTAHTVCAWVCANNLSYYEAILGYSGDSYMSPLTLMNNSGNTRIYYHDGTAYEFLDLGEDITGEWHHIAVVRNETAVDFFLDGVKKGSVTLGSNTTMYADVIGARQGNSSLSFFYSGGLDDVQIYLKTLSAAEIAAFNFNLLSVYSEKNYYTSESNAVAVCDPAMPASELSGCYLTAKDNQNNTLGTNTTPEINTDLTCNISSLGTGSNTITVELRLDSGKLVFSRCMEILKRLISSGVEVKINRRNSSVLYDGNGLFPIGLCMSQITSDNTSAFQEVTAAGFNSIIRWNRFVDPSDATTYLENASLYNLLVIDWLSSYAAISFIDYKDDEDFFDYYEDEYSRLISAVSYAKLEDNLIGYYSFDEPLSPQITAGQDLYEHTNIEDGYHPTIVNYGSLVRSGDEYTNWCDILSIDPYWSPPRVSNEERSSIDWVTKYITLAAARAKQDRKAFWVILMSEYWSQSNKRPILPEEQRCQTYLALINGAKGIFYFRYPICHSESWETLQDLAEELDMLSSAMLTEDISQTINYSSWDGQSYQPVTFDPADKKFVDVQVSLRKAPSGANYDYVLLVANTRDYSVDVDYTISLLTNIDKVYTRVFDPNDTNEYEVSNSSFSDTLAAFATRVYTFDSTSDDSVTIDVAMTPGTNSNPETTYPRSGRSNYTNIMQNPDLEANTLNNWPDYCKPKYAIPRIGESGQGWGLVNTVADTGSKTGLPGNGAPGDDPGDTCLKITKVSSARNGLVFRVVPEQTGTYTFSVYVKA